MGIYIAIWLLPLGLLLLHLVDHQMANFVEINGQIAEVQGQIATLEQRMDNLLARVVLNESRLDGINAGIAL